MEAVAQRLHELFPLLQRLSVLEPETRHSDRLPPYLGLIWAVLDNAPSHPVCFVFPRCGEIARLAAISYCLKQLPQAHAAAIKGISPAAFTEGETVRLHPGKEIFVYRGVKPDDAGVFWLQEVGRNESRTLGLPLSALIRLERTARKLPKGDISRSAPLRSPEPPPIDRLLGSKTHGNLGSVANQVLLLDSKTGFREFAAGLHLQPASPPSPMPPADQLVPMGHVERLGPETRTTLEKWDAYGKGDPILAVASSVEIFAQHCREIPPRSRAVIVNGLSRFGDLQAYDDIARTQPMVLFADQSETDQIGALASRGCRFWYMTGDELIAGSNGAAADSLLGSITRWTRNSIRLSLDEETCDDPRIDAIFGHLRALAGDKRLPAEGAIPRLLSRAWGIFGRLRGSLASATAEETRITLDEIASFRREAKSQAPWINAESAAELERLGLALKEAWESGIPVGGAKGEALKRTITAALASGQKIALVAKNEARGAEVRKWLYDRAFPRELAVHTPRSLPETGFDRLICTAWPGADAMAQVVSRLAAPRITLVGYACERHWLKQSRNRLSARPCVNGLSGTEKSAYISAGKNPVTWSPEPGPVSPSAPPEPDFAIWEFENRLRSARVGLAASPTRATDTLPARYIRFAGDHYCFLTANHRVPVATELVSNRAKKNLRLPERIPADIKMGDFVVFPTSGDRQFLQASADKLLGNASRQLRARAHRWQDALQKSGLTPEAFHQAAEDLGISHHILTFRNWFEHAAQIGPGEKEDLVLIGLVTGDGEFEKLIDDTWTAIEILRAAHLKAGARLRDLLLQRLPDLLGRVEENGTQIDLNELGSAWIVQVDAIAPEDEPRGKAEVNRLLHENGGGPEYLL